MSSGAAVVLTVWRIILTVGLLGCSSEAAVTCRNNNNGVVDWYVLYKAPAVDQLTGVEYLYIDSSSVTEMKPNAPNYKPINDPNGVLANTLRPLFTPIRSMPQTFGFISYSDQPPGCNAHQDFGHSKGVLMVDRTNTGVWLLHSTPRFPFRRNPEAFWPESGKRNAQTFICVTFPYDRFSLIGKHLQYIGAFPFDHDVPADFHQELRDAVNWAKADTIPNNFQTLISSGGQVFQSIAKQQSEQTKVGDLYVTIAGLVDSDLDVQTWGCQRDRARSYCLAHGHRVVNIRALSTGLGTWKPETDHSKWKNKNLSLRVENNK